MGQGSSKERYKNAVKKLSNLELENIEAVFNEISTKTEDGTRQVELSRIDRQDFAERFRLPGFIAERLFHAFDRNEVRFNAVKIDLLQGHFPAIWLAETDGDYYSICLLLFFSQSGTIDLEEFIGGIALCLHGTVKDKCRLLFHIFNLVMS